MPLDVFVKYAEAGYLGEVIPVLPHDCQLTPNSEVNPAQRGKIPGEFSRRHAAWHGMPDWNGRTFTIDDCRKWDRWPLANVGLRARHFTAGDFDMTHVVFRDACIDALRARIGEGPTRFRGDSTRLLIPSHLPAGGDAVSKLALKVKLPDTDDPQLLEILGSGQQYLIAGIHPSGQNYHWEHDIGPLTLGADGLPQVDAATWLDFFNYVETVIVPQFGGEILSSSRKRAAWDGEGAMDIGNAALMAPSADLATEALHCIPDALLDYDAWLRVMFTYKGATGDAGFAAFYQWSKDHPDRPTEEYVRTRWDSITTSSIGWERLLAEAGHYGFKFPEMFPTIDPSTIEQPKPSHYEARRPGECNKTERRWTVKNLF